MPVLSRIDHFHLLNRDKTYYFLAHPIIKLQYLVIKNNALYLNKNKHHNRKFRLKRAVLTIYSTLLQVL